jgi:hypothetical protein
MMVQKMQYHRCRIFLLFLNGLSLIPTAEQPILLLASNNRFLEKYGVSVANLLIKITSPSERPGEVSRNNIDGIYGVTARVWGYPRH